MKKVKKWLNRILKESPNVSIINRSEIIQLNVAETELETYAVDTPEDLEKLIFGL